jgi:hypothetical protein
LGGEFAVFLHRAKKNYNLRLYASSPLLRKLKELASTPLRRRHTTGPMARTPLLMCHGNNHYLSVVGKVEYVEWKSVKN